MKPQVFKRAAKLVNQELFACHALQTAYHKSDTPYCYDHEDHEKFFHKLFKPKRAYKGLAYFNEENNMITKNSQLSRELALLLAYEIAKDSA